MKFEKNVVVDCRIPAICAAVKMFALEAGYTHSVLNGNYQTGGILFTKRGGIEYLSTGTNPNWYINNKDVDRITTFGEFVELLFPSKVVAPYILIANDRGIRRNLLLKLAKENGFETYPENMYTGSFLSFTRQTTNIASHYFEKNRVQYGDNWSDKLAPLSSLEDTIAYITTK